MYASCKENHLSVAMYWQVILLLALRAMSVQILLSWIDRRHYRLIVGTVRTGPSTTP
jgi:hypothetical protein